MTITGNLGLAPTRPPHAILLSHLQLPIAEEGTRALGPQCWSHPSGSGGGMQTLLRTNGSLENSSVAHRQMRPQTHIHTRKCRAPLRLSLCGMSDTWWFTGGNFKSCSPGRRGQGYTHTHPPRTPPLSGQRRDHPLSLAGVVAGSQSGGVHSFAPPLSAPSMLRIRDRGAHTCLASWSLHPSGEAEDKRVSNGIISYCVQCCENSQSSRIEPTILLRAFREPHLGFLPQPSPSHRPWAQPHGAPASPDLWGLPRPQSLCTHHSL